MLFACFFCYKNNIIVTQRQYYCNLYSRLEKILLNRKVSICKRDGDEVFFYGKLADIAEILPFQFARISKSYIVNMKYISSWGYDHVILEKKIRLRISQSQRSEFKNVIYNYNIREVN